MNEEQRPPETPQQDVATPAPTPPVSAVPDDVGPDPESSPAKPVDNPDLPVTGDPDSFDEEPVPEDDFAPADEAAETPEDPIDLSGVDKEFDD